MYADPTSIPRSSPRDTADPRVGRVVGGFRIERRIGAGMTATVYAALRVTDGAHAAVKILAPELAVHPGHVRRFEREAALLARARHDRIVPLLAHGRDGDDVYIATRLVENGNLRDELALRGRLPASRVARIAVDVARAIGALASARIVHRDIKPANLLVDRDGSVRLADLGSALELDDAASVACANGEVPGSRRYMAPEQAARETVDVRADLWALGATLHALLVGAPPGVGGPDLRALRRRARGEHAGLATLIERLLAREREDRPSSARAVVDALGSVIRSCSVSAEARTAA